MVYTSALPISIHGEQRDNFIFTYRLTSRHHASHVYNPTSYVYTSYILCLYILHSISINPTSHVYTSYILCLYILHPISIQTYRYSPEYASYIFSQQIYLIIFFRLSRTIFVYSFIKYRVFPNVTLLGS